MKIKNSLAPFACAAALGVLSLDAAPAQAQDRRFDVYAGYAFLHTDDGSLHGARVSPEYRLSGPLWVAADVSAEKGTLVSTDTTLLTYMGGLRVKKSIGSASIFLHGLAGGLRASSSITPFKGVSISVSDTGLGLDGGGGLEFKLSGLRMRVGADYLRREVDIGGGKTEHVNDIRATVGLVF